MSGPERIEELENEMKQNREELKSVQSNIKKILLSDASHIKREKMTMVMAKLDISRIKEYDPQLAVEVAKVYMEIQKLRVNLDEAKKSEKTAWAENISYRGELEGAQSEIDTLTTTLSRIQSRFDEKVKEVNDLRLDQGDMQMKMGIAESSFQTLIGSLESMHEKLSRRYTESTTKQVRAEMTKNIAFLIEQVNQVMSAKEAKKEAEKKGAEE